jgi:hypothetical protein
MTAVNRETSLDSHNSIALVITRLISVKICHSVGVFRRRGDWDVKAKDSDNKTAIYSTDPQSVILLDS